MPIHTHGACQFDDRLLALGQRVEVAHRQACVHPVAIMAYREGDRTPSKEDAMPRLLAILILLLSGAAAQARDLTVATWNLGWHQSLSEARAWIAACSQPFALKTNTGLWTPTGGLAAPDTKPGWELRWGRDAKIAWDIGAMAPCDVYQASFKIVPVTETAYANRQRQIRDLIARDVNADVIAFQEVSGVEAVREILPDGGSGYDLCGFTGFKVQRLVIAARKSLGGFSECLVEAALSLPNAPVREQPRPGLSATLTIDGKPLRIMTVHLKSSCVSPLEANARNPERGMLEGNDPHCIILQRQVRPIEAWIEGRATVPTIMLGDFNRNLSHEIASIPRSQVRSDGSDPAGPLPSDARVRSLIGEVDDGQPAASKLTLLETTCPINAVSEEFCRRAKSEAFTREELRPLTRSENLGCRNPIGLDHVLVSQGLATGASARKVPLGRLGSARPAGDRFPNPLLALSDHCPLVATVTVS
jgi:endonuclease/exonuclease/phosphatase family metal-dependent hydrolase